MKDLPPPGNGETPGENMLGGRRNVKGCLRTLTDKLLPEIYVTVGERENLTVMNDSPAVCKSRKNQTKENEGN